MYCKKIRHDSGSNVEMFKFSLTWILTTQGNLKKNTCQRLDTCIPREGNSSRLLTRLSKERLHELVKRIVTQKPWVPVLASTWRDNFQWIRDPLSYISFFHFQKVFPTPPGLLWGSQRESRTIRLKELTVYTPLGKRRMNIVRLQNKKISRRRWISGAQRSFQGSKTTLHDTIMIGACHYPFVQTHWMCDTKSEPGYKLCTLRDDVSVWLTNYNKYLTLVACWLWGNDACERQGYIGNLCASSHLCCEPITALKKNKVSIKINLIRSIQRVATPAWTSRRFKSKRCWVSVYKTGISIQIIFVKRSFATEAFRGSEQPTAKC